MAIYKLNITTYCQNIIFTLRSRLYRTVRRREVRVSEKSGFSTWGCIRPRRAVNTLAEGQGSNYLPQNRRQLPTLGGAIVSGKLRNSKI